MAEHGRLSAKQEKALLELVNPSNKTVEGVAKKIGVGERTLYRWLTLPHFKQRLEEEKKKLRHQALDELKATLNSAVSALRELLGSANESIRLRGAQSVIDFNLKLGEIQDVEQRLARLEESISQSRKNV